MATQSLLILLAGARNMSRAAHWSTVIESPALETETMPPENWYRFIKPAMGKEVESCSIDWRVFRIIWLSAVRGICDFGGTGRHRFNSHRSETSAPARSHQHNGSSGKSNKSLPTAHESWDAVVVHLNQVRHIVFACPVCELCAIAL